MVKLVDTCCEGTLSPTQVGHPSHHRQVVVGERVAQDAGHIRHLGQVLGGYKRDQLGFSQTRRHQGIDSTQFIRGGHAGLDRSQAVARPDYADQNIKR